MLRAASDHADLVFHALAFVPPRVDAPAEVLAASLFRPDWVSFARRALEPAAVAPIERDAPLVGGWTSTAELAVALQCFATLHESIAGFLASIRRPLSDLSGADVARPADLAALKAAPVAPVEVFRGALGLAARAFAAAHASALRPFAMRVMEALEPKLVELASGLRGVAALEVQLSATLGPHGRLCGDTVFVGTTTLPGVEGEVDARWPLAVIAHEAAVRAVHEALSRRGLVAPWALLERAALDCGELVYPGTAAEGAYREWRARINESGLALRDATVTAAVKEAAALLRG